MAGKMSDYLSTLEADIDWIFPAVSIASVERGKKKQILHEFDGGNIRVATLSNQSYYDVILTFNVLSDADALEILDFWHDNAKAQGSERTFVWQHPVELDLYTVRFTDVLERERSGALYIYSSIKSIKLRVEGNYEESALWI